MGVFVFCLFVGVFVFTFFIDCFASGRAAGLSVAKRVTDKLFPPCEMTEWTECCSGWFDLPSKTARHKKRSYGVGGGGCAQKGG